MRISPKYKASDFRELDLNNEEDWQLAIDMFKDRMESRFFEPVNNIKRMIYSGFTIMAICCLLIETLQQFYKGVDESPTSKKFFVSFLTKTSFGDYFNENKAKMFYKKIRCGILHQAEIKDSSLILIKRNIPLVKITKDEEGLIINRKLFFKQLETEYNNYINSIKDKNNVELRKNFEQKMKYICRVS